MTRINTDRKKDISERNPNACYYELYQTAIRIKKKESNEKRKMDVDGFGSQSTSDKSSEASMFIKCVYYK